MLCNAYSRNSPVMTDLLIMLHPRVDPDDMDHEERQADQEIRARLDLSDHQDPSDLSAPPEPPVNEGVMEAPVLL